MDAKRYNRMARERFQGGIEKPQAGQASSRYVARYWATPQTMTERSEMLINEYLLLDVDQTTEPESQNTS